MRRLSRRLGKRRREDGKKSQTYAPKHTYTPRHRGEYNPEEELPDPHTVWDSGGAWLGEAWRG